MQQSSPNYNGLRNYWLPNPETVPGPAILILLFQAVHLTDSPGNRKPGTPEPLTVDHTGLIRQSRLFFGRGRP